MGKKDKNIIECKWISLKNESNSTNPNIETIDILSCDLLANLAEMSIRGIKEIDGKSIDLYKDRVWWAIERHGLLPEYNDEEEVFEEIIDNWNKDDDEDEIGLIDEEEIYNQL